MRFCCLGSGSRGNAFVVECGETTLLIDCGFSLHTLKKRLSQRCLSLSEIDAVFISHEHSDHISALSALLKEFNIPCYMSAGTAKALDCSYPWRCLSGCGRFVSVGQLSITPITVPHDVIEPLQFVIDDGGRRLALFTDLGHVSPAVLVACREVDALIIECNYDESLLNQSHYPISVKQRIHGRYGHLSNVAAAHLVARTKSARRQYVIAAHLSQDNNNPNLVYECLTQADLNTKTMIASQEYGCDWLSL